MKRIQEKVKDIVEVRAHKSLRDFTADPAETLSAYFFTDGTADLMAKWLDRVVASSPAGGSALALAGYRGVGKSHFLAAFAAILSHTELRSRVADTHVSSAAHRLARKPYPVIYVRRGLRNSLIEELREAVEEKAQLAASSLPESLPQILGAAVQMEGELPPVVLIDTAFDRGARVARDDGQFLGELGEAAKELGVLLAVALDDDIATADGSNLGISRSFSIDYLDQEHLYKVVNSHVFPKLHHAQPALAEIYSYFREVIPGFRWSEQRFASLYPLHPAILEVAPFVRLYVPDFALLGFSSAAAERILGRPANSLIGLDEVFDNVEKALRTIEDLQEAFIAYDHLNTEVIGKIPILRRLQAKLVLKGLLLLSLDGQGTTAQEIGAAMMIFDEENPDSALSVIDDLIHKFAEELPDEIEVTDSERERRYGFRITGKDSLNRVLADEIGAVPDEAVEAVLRRSLNDRFPDSTLSVGVAAGGDDRMDSHLIWRGGVRRGRVSVMSDGSGEAAPQASTSLGMDWEVIIDLRTQDRTISPSNEGVSQVVWRPAELRKDEADAVRRYVILNTRADLRDSFGDQIRAALHSHAVRAGKIARRMFLEDGKIVLDGFDYNFTDEARAAKSFSELFSIMLEPLFETRYPEHPVLARPLETGDVSLLADLYNPSRRNLPEIQDAARSFALPMGLVVEEDELLAPCPDEVLTALAPAVDVLEYVAAAKKDETVPLVAIDDILRKEPRGLVREAQYLLLMALVAQRQIEFVTAAGERINQRSLDLKIDWEDITGIARPAGPVFSAKKLGRWAAVFAGENASLGSDDGRAAVKEALGKWLGEWHSADVLKKFNQLPDDLLNTRIWSAAARCTKLLGAIAENVRSLLEGTIELEDCLNRIADTVSDSVERFRTVESELVMLDSFIKGVPTRARILSYLSGCEITESAEIEEMREQLFHLSEVSYSNPSDASNRELGYLWTKFERDFAEYFAERHDAVMRSGSLRSSVEELLRGEDWWEFSHLSRLPIFDGRIASEVKKHMSRATELECNFDIGAALHTRPFCRCSFALGREDEWRSLPAMLSGSLDAALHAYRKRLAEADQGVLQSLQAIGTADAGVASEVNGLLELIATGGDLPRLSRTQLQILQTAFQTGDRFAPVQASYAVEPAPIPLDLKDEAVPI